MNIITFLIILFSLLSFIYIIYVLYEENKKYKKIKYYKYTIRYEIDYFKYMKMRNKMKKVIKKKKLQLKILKVILFMRRITNGKNNSYIYFI